MAEEARDRASSNELQVAQLTQTNIALRTKLVELELKVQPRRITPEQVKTFIFLTEKIARIPITISVGQEGFDTEVFAFQLREMFSKAGFGSKEVAGAWGILRDPTRLYARSVGTPPFGAEVILALPSSEVFERFKTDRFNIELTNGIVRPIVTSRNEEDVYAALNFVLQKVGVVPAYWQSQWRPPRAFEVFVPLKEQF